jgi:hypothetical protein
MALKLRGIGRDQARELSVDFVKQLQVKWEGLTKGFRTEFREHLTRLYVLLVLRQSTQNYSIALQRSCHFKVEDKLEEETSTTRQSENHLPLELDE